MLGKNFFILVVILLFTSPIGLAMQLSQPVRLGSISSLPPQGAFKIEGAVSNKVESPDDDSSDEKEYFKGVACFGKDNYTLFVHYDNSYFYTEDFKENLFRSKELAKSCRVGDANIENTLILPIGFPHNFSIYLVTSNANVTFFLLEYDSNGIPSYKLIGKRSDGKWLKYFETVAAEQFYGMTRAFCHNYRVENDTITFEYGRYDPVAKKFINYNEIRFYWEDSTQWFGVEQIICKPVEEKIPDDSADDGENAADYDDDYYYEENE